MSALKVFAVLAIVGGGFGAGFLWNRINPPTPVVQIVEARTATPTNGDEVDPSLILPPPDTKGVMIDPAQIMIKDHFREVAGLDLPSSKSNLGLGNFSVIEQPIQQVEHRQEPFAGGADDRRPVIRFRLNVEFDLDMPRPTTARTPLLLQPLNWNTPELMPMPREVREHRTGVNETEGGLTEELPIPREFHPAVTLVD